MTFFLLADIIELFEAFKEHDVQRNLTIVHLILTAWSISLIQFTLVVTSTKTRKIRKSTGSNEPEKCFSCQLFWETELWVNYYFFLFYIFKYMNIKSRLFLQQFFYKMVHFFVFVLV